MSFRLVLRAEAENEFDKAFDYFEEQQQGLGVEFAEKVQEVFDRIIKMPKMHGIVEDDTRRALVDKFRYSVFYRIEGNDVAVTAIVHQRRDPAIWRGRK